jgi:hypothetical protein
MNNNVRFYLGSRGGASTTPNKVSDHAFNLLAHPWGGAPTSYQIPNQGQNYLIGHQGLSSKGKLGEGLGDKLCLE